MKALALTLALLLATPALAQDDPAYLDDRSTPEAVISSFYNAIDRHEYARAWSYYQDGMGVAPFADFESGYQNTDSVTVNFGETAQEGAAGSTYYTVPVVVVATDVGGETQRFAGCYTLRLVQPANQAEPPFRPMHIVEGKLKTDDSAAATFAPAKCDP